MGEDEEFEMVSGSPPEEIYAHFANRRSPGAGRRRRGKQGRRGGGMEAEHFVRIADTEPTKARPLQGLWKVLLLYTCCIRSPSTMLFSIGKFYCLHI